MTAENQLQVRLFFWRQETVDSLEMVRQLFELGFIQSAFWHQFALTAHSPIGINPGKYNITPTLAPISFANNDIQFTDSTGIDHDKFSFGLKKSLYNFMHDQCFDYPLQEWFDFKIPHTKVRKDFIKSCVHSDESFSTKSSQKFIWLGNTPLVSEHSKSKKGKTWQMLQFTFHDKAQSLQIALDLDKGRWFEASLESISVHAGKPMTFEQLKNDFESSFENFELFWYSKPLLKLKNFGLLAL